MEVAQKQLRGLYGCSLNEKRMVGYCRHHKCYLTSRTLKKHECLKKQCKALVKNESHGYWANRERIKQLKKERRERYFG